MHDLTDLTDRDIEDRIAVLQATEATPSRDEIECHCGDEFDDGVRVDFCIWDDEWALREVLASRTARR